MSGRSPTPASVTAAVRSALEKNPDIAAFISLSDTDLALAAGREARKAGKVFVTSGATSPLLPGQVGGHFFLAWRQPVRRVRIPARRCGCAAGPEALPYRGWMIRAPRCQVK